MEMIHMRYTVRVKHSSAKVPSKSEDFEKDTRDDEELKALHDEAVREYLAAVQEYDHGHTVSLFRVHGEEDKGTGAVTVHEALGTGSGQLPEEDEDDDASDSQPAVSNAADNQA